MAPALAAFALIGMLFLAVFTLAVGVGAIINAVRVNRAARSRQGNG